jgi:hypothetical protein
MSGALRTGDFWSKIPTYEHRANCTHCPNELEMLDHILTECAHPATRLIWNLVKQKWPDDEHNWPKIHQGHILGCGSIQPNPDNDNEVTTGKSAASPASNEFCSLNRPISSGPCAAKEP